MIRTLTAMLAILALPIAGCMVPQEVRSNQMACAAATAKISAARQLPLAHVASCDAGSDNDVPGYYVVALRGHCREEICGSTLIGWFAVRKTDAAVFEFDVGEWKVAQPVGVETFPG